MWMIVKAWNQVNKKSITNCFKKSRFKVDDEEDDLSLVKLCKTYQRVQEEFNFQDTKFEELVIFGN